MAKKWLVISGCILILASVLRLYHFPERTPFDWDQNRDYQKVAAIVDGKVTLLGPIAKGDTGFYLGPLYYYLLIPLYLAFHGHPFAFPLTSIILDLVVVGVILWLANMRHKERLVLTLLALLWATSWFAIENSHVSWNVSLLPLWIILMYAFGSMLRSTPLRLVLYGMVAGLAWHIHASLIPLSLVLPMFFLPSSLSRLRSYLFLMLGYLLALTPLIFFDLRHAMFNTHLILNFATVQRSIPHTDILVALMDVVSKLGRNFLGLLGGPLRGNIWLGALTLILALWALTREAKLRLLGLIVILNVLFALALRDLQFPEYYLAATYLPLLYISLSFLIAMPAKQLILSLSLLVILSFNLHSYTFDSGPYSLANKIAVVNRVAALNEPVDARYELTPGREGGIIPLLTYSGVTLSESAPTKIIFSDQPDGPIVIGDNIASDLIRVGGLRAALFRLQ